MSEAQKAAVLLERFILSAPVPNAQHVEALQLLNVLLTAAKAPKADK